MLKVEEKDGLRVISLLFTIELLVDTHKQLWEKPCLGHCTAYVLCFFHLSVLCFLDYQIFEARSVYCV